MSTVPAVIRTTLVVDLWARLLSITVKAIVGLLSFRDSSNSNNGRPRGLCLSGRLATCSPLYRCGRRFDVLRGGGSERLRASPRVGGESLNDNGGGASLSGRARTVCGAWRGVCLSLSEWFCGGPYRFGWYRRVGAEEGRRRGGGGSSGDEEGQDEEVVAAGGLREGNGSAALLSRAGRQVSRVEHFVGIFCDVWHAGGEREASVLLAREDRSSCSWRAKSKSGVFGVHIVVVCSSVFLVVFFVLGFITLVCMCLDWEVYSVVALLIWFCNAGPGTLFANVLPTCFPQPLFVYFGAYIWESSGGCTPL